MESKNLTSDSIEELTESLIGKEENLLLLQGGASRPKGCSIDRVRQPPPKDFGMEKNESTSIGSSEKPKELIIDVDENLESWCIYRVPRALRKTNEEAYTPKVISIGPLHHGKDEFADMDKQKKRYKTEFGKRIGSEKWQELEKFIEDNEQSIRDSYEEYFNPEKPDQFRAMILDDAVFIIELFLKDYGSERDFLVHRSCLRETISMDLRLLENQLPLFVLDGLHKLAIPNLGPENGDHSFISLSCVFFRHCERNAKVRVKAEDVLHFTDLSSYFMTRSRPKRGPEQGEQDPEQGEQGGHLGEQGKQGGHLRDLPCAAKLQRSGVQFEGIESECSLDIKFGNKKLEIPRIVVDDYTERLMRNLMAFEQCHYPKETVICNYIDLMDRLINTDEDVNLLAEAGIISNDLGESARTAKMFNDLCLEIRLERENYTDIIKALIDHYDNPWNNAKATLKTVYFSNLWKGSGTVAAFLLLVFNLIQAMRTIISAFE